MSLQRTTYPARAELGPLTAPGLLLVLVAGTLSGCLARSGSSGPASASPAASEQAATLEVLPGPVSASAVAVDSAGTRLAAVNPDSDSVTLVDLSTLTSLAEVPVGDDPRTLSFTPDGAWLLVANLGAGSVTVVDTALAQAVAAVPVGSRPYGVVAGSRSAYLSLAGQPEVVVVDLARRAIAGRVAVAPFPTGLALAADQASLFVTHLYSGTLSVIDTPTLTLRQVLAAEAEANLSQFVALSPDGARAYLPQTLSFSGNPSLAYNTAVRPSVHVVNLVSAWGPAEPRLDLAQIDRPVNLPFAAVVSGDGARLYVVNAGSDDVSVIDLASGQALAHMAAGRNPRGVALAPNGERLFVVNALDGTLDVFDTRTSSRVATVALTQIPLPAQVLAGKRLFNSASEPMSQAGWVSCATCHLDGGADARTWAGFPDGPRNTPALFDVAQTFPLHWNGNLDELQDDEQTIRAIQGGAGLIGGEAFPTLGPPNAGRSAALDALAAYMATLTAPASPYAPAAADAAAAETMARGERAFQRWGCAVCHAAPLYTDQQLHVSGIGDPALERNQSEPLPRFDTPSLRGAWATAPYFHDGSALTLRDTLFSTGFHNMGPAMNAQEVEDLVAYMRALP